MAAEITYTEVSLSLDQLKQFLAYPLLNHEDPGSLVAFARDHGVDYVPCIHCKYLRKEHAGRSRQCPFSSTYFVALDDPNINYSRLVLDWQSKLNRYGELTHG